MSIALTSARCKADDVTRCLNLMVMQLRLPHQSFRPATRPSHGAAARLWWRYAFRAVGTQLRQGRPSWWDLTRYLRVQREYVPLYVAKLQESVAAAQGDARVQELDKGLPYQVMLHLRKMAHAKVRRHQKRKAQQAAPPKRSWVGWALGAKPAASKPSEGSDEQAADAEGEQSGEGGAEAKEERGYLTAQELQTLEDLVQEQARVPHLRCRGHWFDLLLLPARDGMRSVFGRLWLGCIAAKEQGTEIQMGDVRCRPRSSKAATRCKCCRVWT